jgi:hypothetical protein
LKTVNRKAAESGAGYTQIGNAMLRDERLSLEARGCLSLALSRPENWQFSGRRFFGKGSRGYRICHEVVRFGYCRRTRERKPDGTWGPIAFEFTDVPNAFAPLPQNREVVDEPLRQKPHVDDPTLDNVAPTKNVSPERKIENENSQSAQQEKVVREGDAEDRLPFSQRTLQRIEGMGIPAKWLIGRYLTKTKGKRIKNPDAYLFRMAEDEFSKRHGVNVAMVRQATQRQEDLALGAAALVSQITAAMNVTPSKSLRDSAIVHGGRR